MSRVTASKSALVAACGYWARHDVTLPDDPPGPAAERGTRFHAAIAAYVETGESQTVEPDIAAEMLVACDWVDAFGRDKLEAEVAFAWDPDRDVAIRLDVRERGYPEHPTFMFGTADLVAVNRSLRVGYLGDWKTGDGSKALAQLKTLALMLARADGLESVTVEALEVDPSGVRVAVRETLDTFALAEVAVELADALARVPKAEPQPGAHCRDLYCPMRAECPAGDVAVAQLVPAEMLTRRLSTEIRTPDDAAWALDVVRLVEAKCKAIREAIGRACPPGGWQLADGSVLRETSASCRGFNKAKAIEVLKRLGATAQDIDECYAEFKKSNGLRVAKPKGRRVA